MSKEISHNEKLTKDVRALYDMELNNYLMARTIAVLSDKINNLGNRRYFEKPEKKNIVSTYASTGGWAGLGIAIGAGIGGCSGCANSSGIFSAIDNLVGGLFIGGLIGLALGGVIGFMVDSSRKDDAQQKADSEYQTNLTRYNQNVALDEQRVARENKLKTVLRANRETLQQKYNHSIRLLGAMYEVVGIDRDFRSLVSIGYMYDFLRLGISNSLTGIDGLYYLIQQRIHWDVLHATMEDISRKLDTIINNQDRIYYELQAMNDKSDKLIQMTSKSIELGIQNGQKLQSIEANTDIAAYNIERMRAEEEFRHMVGWN